MLLRLQSRWLPGYAASNHVILPLKSILRLEDNRLKLGDVILKNRSLLRFLDAAVGV